MKAGMHSDRVLLAHILECIERIREYTGGDRASFYDSRLVQDAVVRNLQTLAESTQRLSEAIKATERNVPVSSKRNWKMTRPDVVEAGLVLPRSVADLLQRVACAERHPGLQLDKFSPLGKQDVQRYAVERVCGATGDATLLSSLSLRRSRMFERAGARRFRAVTAGPLTLHLARASGLENAGIQLHPVYGFACLPGSGLKGMARAYAETVWVQDQPDPGVAWKDIPRSCSTTHGRRSGHASSPTS